MFYYKIFDVTLCEMNFLLLRFPASFDDKIIVIIGSTPKIAFSVFTVEQLRETYSEVGRIEFFFLINV